MVPDSIGAFVKMAWSLFIGAAACSLKFGRPWSGVINKATSVVSSVRGRIDDKAPGCREHSLGTFRGCKG